MSDASISIYQIWKDVTQKPSQLFPRLKWNKLLGLYRAWYFDLNVHHFHEKLKQEPQIALSYSWVQEALQDARLGS